MTYKAGFLALIGLPNAGKSTLANLLVGQKFSIVCSKAQTTRKRILGIYNDEDMQIILVDAPGVIKKTTGINQFLQEEYKDVIKKSDALAVCLNLDAKNVEDLISICDMAQASEKPWFILITKEDLVNKSHRLSILKERLKDYNVPIIPFSSVQYKNKSKKAFIKEAYAVLPASEAPLYPKDYYTLENVRDLVSETVREKCFEYLHQEIPYGLAVQIRAYKEGEKIDKIYADILIEKESYKSILIGKNGQHLKRIGTSARLEIEKYLDKKVYLELHVKIKEKWTKNPRVLKELGYVRPS